MWISVKERKPDYLQRVLVYFKSGQISIVDYHPSMIWWETDITHWQPLPKAPELEKSN